MPDYCHRIGTISENYGAAFYRPMLKVCLTVEAQQTVQTTWETCARTTYNSFLHDCQQFGFLGNYLSGIASIRPFLANVQPMNSTPLG